MPHNDQFRDVPRAQGILRRYSPWEAPRRSALPRRVAAADATRAAASAAPWRATSSSLLAKRASLRSRRRFRLFWAGRATKGGSRGDLFRHHLHRRSFLLHDTSGRFPPTSLANTSDPEFFARAMRSSDFCFSPLGQSDGDSDRYVPALLYGCVPVFASVGEALPFDEVVNWRGFSLTLPGGARDVHQLAAVLRNVSDDRLQSMRVAMGSAWQRVLWTSVHVEQAKARSAAEQRGRQGRSAAGSRGGKGPAGKGMSGKAMGSKATGSRGAGGYAAEDETSPFSYLGEPPHHDAFSMLIAVLRRRLRLAPVAVFVPQ